MFHNTFYQILHGTDDLQKTAELLDPCITSSSIDPHSFPKTVNTVEKLAPIFIKGVQREQELLETNNNYYIARDSKTNTIYMCFKNLLMIDIDCKDVPFLNDNFVMEYFSDFKDKCFAIYKSNAGYHVFCVSHEFDYRDPCTVQFMLENFCDLFYCIFSYIRGFCVRLNRKFIEDSSKPLYTSLGTVGNTKLAKPTLVNLVYLHLQQAAHYNNTRNLST